MTENDAVNKIREEVMREGTQARFAERAELPQSYISDVLNGKRRPSDKLLRAVGLARVLVALDGGGK